MNSTLPQYKKKSPIWSAGLLWVIPILFFVVFFFIPLKEIFEITVVQALDSPFSSANWQRVWRSIHFTFTQAFISMFFTLLIGLPGAFLFSRFKFKGKKLLKAASTIPFIMPTVVVAASFNALLGPKGLLNYFLMGFFDLDDAPIRILNTLAAIVLAHIFYNTSVILRMVGSAWEQLDPQLEHAARSLGASAWKTWWKVTFPLLKTPILAAALLVFLFDFTSFGVVLLLGGPAYATMEVEIYIQAMHMLNLPLAGLLSAIQLGFTLILTIVYSRLVRKSAYQTQPRVLDEEQRSARTIRQKLFVWIMVFLLFTLLVTPLAALSVRSFTRLEAERGQRTIVDTGITIDYYASLFQNPRSSIFYVPPIAAVRNSMLYAGVTILISLFTGLLAAYALSKKIWVNKILDPILMLPLGTSAVTLGLGFILVFNKPPLDVRSFPLLMPIAHSLVALPFVIRTLLPAIQSVPRSLKNAAAVLGAAPMKVWQHVDFPIIARAAFVAAIFSFTISLGEFGATSFLARPEFPTIPVAIYRYLSQPGALNYGQALAMANILMVVCGISIYLMESVQANAIREV
ncbi:MAG: iron ABC transporter permease [Anaerolineaceae bacterium]|nr:iron ABC transporter permease [Anaerolineaceae bacterium]